MRTDLKKMALAVAAVVALVSAGTGVWAWRSSPGAYSGTPESIIIGSAPLESSALIYIAEDQRFFAANGLNVTMRNYNTGAASVNGLLNGEVDIAVPAEYPLVGSAFKKEKISAIASIDKVQYFFLFGRKDRGIEKAADLKGKKIGVVQKTIAEFYLGRFLELHGIDTGQVTLADVNLSQSEHAITNGDVDAILSRPPYASAIEKRLDGNGVIWPAQSSQALYAILVGKDSWIEAQRESVDRLLRALAQAEDFILKYPDEAKAIVQDRLGFDDAYMEEVWSQNQFSLSLDRSLVVALEDEARWMISSGLTDEQQVPNFLDHIYEDPLRAAKPGAVNIIR